MTQDPALREPAQRALDYIVADTASKAWRMAYSPQVGSDTSVTGWMMMALKSGELANLEVPDDTYARIRPMVGSGPAVSRASRIFTATIRTHRIRRATRVDDSPRTP